MRSIKNVQPIWSNRSIKKLTYSLWVDKPRDYRGRSAPLNDTGNCVSFTNYHLIISSLQSDRTRTNYILEKYFNNILKNQDIQDFVFSTEWNNIRKY